MTVPFSWVISQAQVCQEECLGQKILPEFQYSDYVAVFSLLELFPPSFYSLCCHFPDCAPLPWAWWGTHQHVPVAVGWIWGSGDSWDKEGGSWLLTGLHVTFL